MSGCCTQAGENTRGVGVAHQHVAWGQLQRCCALLPPSTAASPCPTHLYLSQVHRGQLFNCKAGMYAKLSLVYRRELNQNVHIAPLPNQQFDLTNNQITSAVLSLDSVICLYSNLHSDLKSNGFIFKKIVTSLTNIEFCKPLMQVAVLLSRRCQCARRTAMTTAIRTVQNRSKVCSALSSVNSRRQSMLRMLLCISNAELREYPTATTNFLQCCLFYVTSISVHRFYFYKTMSYHSRMSCQ